MSEPQTFRVRVNDGATHDIVVNTGVYASAAAAVPALLGVEDFPFDMSIWVDDLQPDYPPLCFRIVEAGGAAQLLVWRRDAEHGDE